MSAKAKLALVAAAGGVLLGACSDMKRFLPPGLVKYEDLAKDQPIAPALQEAIDAEKTARDARYPRLSEQPSAAPKKSPAAERDASLAEIEASGLALRAQVEADREAAARDRADNSLLGQGD